MAKRYEFLQSKQYTIGRSIQQWKKIQPKTYELKRK